MYTDRANRINVVDVATKQVSTILEDKAAEPVNVSFSSDNNWLMYVRVAPNQFSMVYVYNLNEKKEYPVTDKWYGSSQPVFSTDGKYPVFTSARDFNPTYGSLEWNHVYNDLGGVCLALLSKETPSPFLEKDDWDSVASKDDEKKEEAGKPVVKIDPDGLADRIVSVPVQGSRYSNFYSDGKKVYYQRSGNTYMYDLKKQKEEVIIEKGVLAIEPLRTKALVAKGKTLYVIDIPSAKVELKDSVKLTNMKITTDYAKEWAQIFDEGWRAFRDGFYVENMHGVDWKAMKDKYAVFLPYVKNRLGLNYVIGEMIGELNCGHAYINTGEVKSAERIRTGMLGAEISRDKSGFFRLEKILPGASWSKKLRSPLTDAGIDAKEGEYIVAIDGVPTNTVNDMYQLLVGKANVPTELALNTKPQLAGARKVVISPLVEEATLYHYNWVQENVKKSRCCFRW